MNDFTAKNINLEPETDDIGQLSLDVYQTEENIVVIAPIAGVTMNDVKVSITDEVLTIEGNRTIPFEEINAKDLFTQECYWGKFSRSIILPTAVDRAKIKAGFKNGILKITVPKTEQIKTKVIQINTDD